MYLDVSIEDAISRLFHLIELQNIQEEMKLIVPKVQKIREDEWSKLKKSYSLLEEIKKLAETEYKELSKMPKIRNQPKYYGLLKLKNQQYIDHINNILKDLEAWFWKKEQTDKDYTSTRIGFGVRERPAKKTPEQTLNKITTLLTYVEGIRENFKGGRFKVYRALEEDC